MPEEIPWWWAAVAVPVAVALWNWFKSAVVPHVFEDRRDKREFRQQSEGEALHTVLELLKSQYADSRAEKTEALQAIQEAINNILFHNVQANEAIEDLVREVQAIGAVKVEQRLRTVEHRLRADEAVRRMIVSLVTNIYNKLFGKEPGFIDEDFVDDIE